MKIIGAHYNDNTVSAIYRGRDLIYTVKEICIESIAEWDEEGGYIYIDDLELQYGYKYEIDFAPPSDYPYDANNNHICIIGGSYAKSGSDYYGLFLGYPYSGYASGGLGIRINTYVRRIGHFAPEVQVPYIPGIRQTVQITYTGEDEPVRTNGGFFLFANRAYDTGDEYVKPQEGVLVADQTKHLYGYNGEPAFGKFYRITIKDSNDVPLRDFVPYKMNGHKGMYDRVTGKFYACADDSKFRIRRA